MAESWDAAILCLKQPARRTSWEEIQTEGAEDKEDNVKIVSVKATAL